MMGLGVTELMIILLIALVIFGAGKLPEIGSALGKGIQNFKKSSEAEPQHELPRQDNPTKAESTDQVASEGGGGRPTDQK